MMLDLKKLFPKSKFPTAEELKAKENTFSMGDRVKVSDNIRCRQHGQTGTIVRIDPEDKYGWKSFIVKFDDEKYNSMGFNSGSIDKILESGANMTKINENTKVTLTLKQLKRLVKETSQDWFGPDFLTEGEMLIEYRGPGGDVVVPEGILSIAMPAFEGRRDKITSLSLPATLVQIAPSSISFLRNIRSYSVAEGNPKFSSKNGMLLSKDGETLFQGIGGDAIIPDGVKEIADEAFAFLNLKSVVIPEGVTSIGEVAFCGCEDLTKVVIPTSVETLKEDAFRDCAGLSKVDILNPKLRDEVMQDPSKCFHGTPWSSTDELEVKESLESSSDEADALIDQIYRMIEAGDAARARAFFNRNRNTIAKSYPGSLRELESLINDNL